MAHGRTIEVENQLDASTTAPAADPQLGFGAEYRELARQRRFVRSADGATAAAPAAGAGSAPAPAPAPAPATTPTWQSAVARPVAPATQAAPDPAPSAPGAPVAAASPAPPSQRTPAPLQSHRSSTRISDDQRAVLAELSRMSDQLVQSREELARVTMRAERAELDVAAANDRLMAARVLVQDAQRATHASAERNAWLEGRCETLQEALDLAVNASFLSRWRWRRQLRTGA